MTTPIKPAKNISTPPFAMLHCSQELMLMLWQRLLEVLSQNGNLPQGINLLNAGSGVAANPLAFMRSVFSNVMSQPQAMLNKIKNTP